MWEKLRPAVTDPARIRRTDPGTPEVCNIYHLHSAFSPPPVVEEVAVNCRTAGWGCIECKKVLHGSIDRELTPIRERAIGVSAQANRVEEVLAAGAERAGTVAQVTLGEVKARMGFA